MVLNGIDVSIRSGERIGVVGRTGSGKSSLLLCLMRIVEPHLPPGLAYSTPPIQIDGRDILAMGLQELRSKIGIIPQNPVLFSGDVRANLDPFGEHDDATIWDALGKCRMKQAVKDMGGLAAAVSEFGENLSQGQRQLLCLGRALIDQQKVLLLDEATSSVDFETDQLVQETLRDAFKGSTVVTIAHRINTIMDSDRILVLKEGKVAEFAPPAELLADDTSAFAEMAKHAASE